MSINNITPLTRVIDNINNPNLQVGTLLQEIPSDIGRSYEGYKRGGIIEGAEKFRKEVMSAFVWLFGIPAFNKLGNIICERVLSPNIPMNIDYSNAKDGRDTIRDSVNYLVTGKHDKNLDVTELKQYKDKFRNCNPETLIKRVKGAKQITSIIALVTNCFLMGVALPKINQAITSRKLNQANDKKLSTFDVMSMEEFKNSLNNDKKNKDKQNFTGLADVVTYGVNNSNRFRLIATDLPMIIGRGLTARNKYEALEIALMDTTSIYFYNFARQHVQELFGKLTKTPQINPKLAEYVSNIDLDTLKSALQNSKDTKNKTLSQVFNKGIADDIYTIATYGKYGKINRFVKNSTLEGIDKSVIKFINQLNKNDFLQNCDDATLIKESIKKMNYKNAGFVGLGLAISVYGLGKLVPKLGYFVTKKLTGKDEFSGIADYSDKNKK